MLSLKIEPFPKFPICSFSIFPNGFIEYYLFEQILKFCLKLEYHLNWLLFLNTLESATTASIV